MTVIVNAADHQSGRLVVFANPRHVGVETVTNGRIRQQRFTMFGGPNSVNVDLNQRLPHDANFSRTPVVQPLRGWPG